MNCVYSIGGGKGGTGKSFVAASLGILLAKQGKRVILVDLDLGGSNLHTFLGLKNPQKGLEVFVSREMRRLEDVKVSTGIPNLDLVTSARCSLEIANLFYAQKTKIMRGIRTLSHDYVILDLGSGTHFNTLDFFLAADEGFLLTTPEPTAIENIFRFIKSIYFREFKRKLTKSGRWLISQGAVAELLAGKMRSPSELISMLQENDMERASSLQDSLNRLKFRVIVNRCNQQSDVNLGKQMVNVCNRHFPPGFLFLGNITYDTRVHDTIVSNTIFVQKYPYTKTAMDLQHVVKTLVGERALPTEVLISK
jgi:flagellar biosynthesis protein FlhG